MRIIDRVIEVLRNRGFRIRIIHDDSVKADLNRLRAKVWVVPGDYFPWWSNPLDMIEELELNDINALFVVSERPYVISDYIVNNLSRARYWFNKELNIKVYTINIDRLEEDLEDGINLAITNFYREASNVVLMGDACPSCGSPMTLVYSSRYYSRRWRTWVNEYVEVCDKCRVISHRLILS
ncbi:hypothetical protein JCM16161A_23840 [Vulcanisaeta sp. JCM 16161]|uniref:hypothetical protein n=1 Tax=Vulcanisaeta sp. JCM 16161 TaxID=1295372 RepID=UPI0006D22EC4|nr:hypothetical protein [Vulcanisaeta sp. JCM 16161]